MTTLHVEKMTINEKLQAIDLLWDDCFRHDESVPSPAWHEKYIQAVESSLELGEDHFVDWQEAKKSIRNFRK